MLLTEQSCVSPHWEKNIILALSLLLTPARRSTRVQTQLFSIAHTQSARTALGTSLCELLYLIRKLSVGQHQRQVAWNKLNKLLGSLCMGTWTQCFLIRYKCYNSVLCGERERYLNVVCITAAPGGSSWDQKQLLCLQTQQKGAHMLPVLPQNFIQAGVFIPKSTYFQRSDWGRSLQTLR